VHAQCYNINFVKLEICARCKDPIVESDGDEVLEVDLADGKMAKIHKRCAGDKKKKRSYELPEPLHFS
jgi:hypothetical protein